MLFDTHAHLVHEDFQDDWPDVVKNLQANMALVVNIGCDINSCRQSIRLAETYDFIYASVGLHPNDAKDYTPEIWQEISQLALHPKVVGIGETGLDYYWDDATPEEQKQLLFQHFELARAVKKPLIIHDRDAHQDIMTALKQGHAHEIGGIFHAYSGSWEMAKQVLDMNFYISLAGPVTFKNANKLLDIAKNVPLDRLLLETDCPYMTPAPFRGKRNEPMYVKYIAEKIAELRGINSSEVIQATYENGKRVFSITQ